MRKISPRDPDLSLSLDGVTALLAPPSPTLHYLAQARANTRAKAMVQEVEATLGQDWAELEPDLQAAYVALASDQAFILTYVTRLDGLELDGKLEPLSYEGLAYIQQNRPGFVPALKTRIMDRLHPREREKKD